MLLEINGSENSLFFGNSPSNKLRKHTRKRLQTKWNTCQKLIPKSMNTPSKNHLKNDSEKDRENDEKWEQKKIEQT